MSKKITFIRIVALVLAFTLWQQALYAQFTPVNGGKFTLTGEIAKLDTGYVVISTLDDSIIAQSAIAKGKFQLNGNLPYTGAYKIALNRTHHIVYFLNDTIMHLTGTLFMGRLVRDIKITGSLYEDEYQRYFNSISHLSNEYEKTAKVFDSNSRKGIHHVADSAWSILENIRDSLRMQTMTFVKNSQIPLVASYVAMTNIGSKYDYASKLYDCMSKKARSYDYGKLFYQKLQILRNTATGKKMPDLAFPDSSGNIIRLSDFKGKILVVDFWASWCGPCRREIPGMKELYKEFQNKGVEFIGVSLDEREGDWIKALNVESMPWPQMAALGRKDTFKKNFGFSGIPFIVVADPEGRVVTKDLRRNSLREALLLLVSKYQKSKS